MNYTMTVTIYDPNTKEGMNSDIVFILHCSFAYDPTTYGNGHYVKIKGECFDGNVYDLRYDKTFRKDRKREWLTDWAYAYWSGKDGAYAVKHLIIRKDGLIEMFPKKTEIGDWCVVSRYDDGTEEMTAYTFPTRERALHHCETVMSEKEG